MKKNVANIFYIADFDCSQARMSGEAGHVRGIVRAFAALGSNVRLFASGWTARMGEKVTFVKIPQLERPGAYALTFGIFCPPIMFWSLVFKKPDIIISRYFKFVLPLVMLARMFRVPVFLEVNSDIRSERMISGGGRLRNSFETWMEKQSCALASGIVAVSDSVAASMHERFPDLSTRVEVIPNGVDTELYHPRDIGQCRTSLGLPQGRHYIAFSGAFQRYQGLPTLIDALAILKESRTDVTLLLVGDGPDRSEVEARVRKYDLESNCRLYGWLPEADAAVVIGACEVSVAPYNLLASGTTEQNPSAYGARLRGSPLKIFTYLACGRPVVASHFNEAGAFVASIHAGIAVPPEDAVSLAAAINRILSDPHAEQMGENGHKEILVNHGWDATARRLLAFAQSFLPSIPLNHPEHSNELQ